MFTAAIIAAAVCAVTMFVVIIFAVAAAMFHHKDTISTISWDDFFSSHGTILRDHPMGRYAMGRFIFIPRDVFHQKL